MSNPPPDKVATFMRRLGQSPGRRGRCPACHRPLRRYDEKEDLHGKTYHKRCVVFSTDRV